MSHIPKISRWLGAAGVSSTENPRARKVGLIFELPMLVAALGILLRWWGGNPPIFNRLGFNRSLQHPILQ